MRVWISGPRILGRRTGVSFGPEDFRRLGRGMNSGPARPRPSAFVYVVKATSGHVKVGVAADPLARLAALQTGASEPLELAYACAVKSNDGYAIEQAAHAMLCGRRLAGEWFDATPDLAVAAIAAASHRLRDPIVEIPVDMIATALAIAAQRDAAAGPRQRSVLGWAAIHFLWTFAGSLAFSALFVWWLNS
jgi:T5orf172 domain